MNDVQRSPGVGRRRRRCPRGCRAPCRDARSVAAGPCPRPIPESPAAAGDRPGVGARRVPWRRGTDPCRLAQVPARPRTVDVGDRRDGPRQSRPRVGGRPRRRPLAAGRRRADRGGPARHAHGGIAPSDGADRPRGGVPERGRRHPIARAGRHCPATGGGRARLAAGCLGGGTSQRRVTADPRAGNLVPDRPPVRRCAGAGRVLPDAGTGHAGARFGGTEPDREPQGPDGRLGRCGRRARPGPDARVRRRPRRVHAPVASRPSEWPAVVRGRRDCPGALHAPGPGGRDLRGQARRSRAVPPLAARRRRGPARPLADGARCAPRHGDHHRPGQSRAPRRT